MHIIVFAKKEKKKKKTKQMFEKTNISGNKFVPNRPQ